MSTDSTPTQVSGLTAVKYLYKSGAGQFWTGTAFEAYLAAHYDAGNYNVTCAETFPGTYDATTPTGVANQGTASNSGDYSWLVVQLNGAGGTNDHTVDRVIGFGSNTPRLDNTRRVTARTLVINDGDLALSASPVTATVTVNQSINASVTGTTPLSQVGPFQLAVDYPFTLPFAMTGLNASNLSQVVFTLKAKETDADSAAAVTMKITIPGAGSDGLTILNGAAPSGATSAADGSISGATGTATTLAFTLNLTSRGSAIPVGSYFGEITYYCGGVKQAFLGYFAVDAVYALRQNPVQS